MRLFFCQNQKKNDKDKLKSVLTYFWRHGILAKPFLKVLSIMIHSSVCTVWPRFSNLNNCSEEIVFKYMEEDAFNNIVYSNENWELFKCPQIKGIIL